MNAIALNPSYGIPTGTTSSITTGSTDQATGFGAIIEQLLVSNGNSQALSLGATEGGIQDLLLQLFGSGETGEESEIINLLLQLFGATDETSLSVNPYADTDSNGELANILSMMGIMPSQETDAGLNSVANLGQFFSQETDSAGFSQLMQVISQMPTTQQQQFLSNIQKSQNTANLNLINSLLTSSESNTGGTNTADTVQQLINLLGGTVTTSQQAVSGTNGTALESFSDTLARMQVTNAMQGSNADGQSADETLDIEALQQSLSQSSGRVTDSLFTATAGSSDTQVNAAKAENIAMQLANGLQNLAQTKEFTVKLSPAGLGEITVSMTETAGKMSLALTATSAETARLLNSEIATLQSTLKAYQPEAETIIVVQTSQSETGNDYISNGFTQQQQTNNRANSTVYSVDGEITVEQDTQDIIAQLANNLLSARV